MNDEGSMGGGAVGKARPAPVGQPDADEHEDEVVLLECNLDDMTPEALGYVMERVLAEGALDAWFTPIYMKKNRPGTLLAVLCRPANGPALRDLVLRETSSLGVRWQMWRRQVAGRSVDRVHTPWGPVRRKLKWLGGEVVSIKPEYDDCSRLAREQNVPLQQIIQAARDAQAED
jgi:pyridinium-3,5-bisthiocarboxylic acid mononucleotide nickel chelatase